MYHDDTQYFGEDYAKGPDSTVIALVEGNKIHEAFDSLFNPACSIVVGGKAVFVHAGNINLINARKWGKASFFQQFGQAIRMKRKSTYFNRVQANTRLAKSAVFKRMRELS